MPRLVIKKGEGVGRDHVLGAGTCSVGRDHGADFTLDDHLVSRMHFQVSQEGGAYWVEDLGSTNGTLVNGRKVARAQLVDGDRIVVGATQLAFVQKDILAGTGAASKVKQPPIKAAGKPPAKPTVAEPPEAPKPKKKFDAPVRKKRRR